MLHRVARKIDQDHEEPVGVAIQNERQVTAHVRLHLRRPDESLNSCVVDVWRTASVALSIVIIQHSTHEHAHAYTRVLTQAQKQTEA
eukprot:4624868-Pleurochrysis_carterae.AAC.1